jgi:hypothetical protein
MSDYESPIDRLLNIKPQSAELIQRKKDLAYEDKVVRFLLTRYKLSSQVRRRLEMDSFNKIGTRQLSLESFCNLFTDFPMQLCGKNFWQVGTNSPISKWYSDFANRPFTKAFQDFCDENAGEASRPLGLVFPWPNLRGQKDKPGTPAMPGGTVGLIVHNDEPCWKVPGLRVVWASGKVKLTVEPFAVFLRGMDYSASGSAKGLWSPSEYFD